MTDTDTGSGLTSWIQAGSGVAFESDYMDKKLRLLRVFLPVGIVLFVVFIPWDFMMAPQVAPTTFIIRMLLCLSLFVLWLVTPTRFMRESYDWVMSAALIGAGFSTAVILSLIPNGFGAASGGIAMAIMFAAGAIRLSAMYTAFAAGGITIATLLVMYATGEPTSMLISKAMTLGWLSALAVLYNIWFRRDAFSIFRYARRLESEQEQTQQLLDTVTTMREERVTWLENLARFLKHEMRNQVAAVRTSLDVIEEFDPEARSKRYVDRARRSLDRMRRLVESASEATSLEAALSAEHIEPFDLSAVLGERVVDFRCVHPSFPLRADIEPGVAIRGNEDRVAQLVDKLLDNSLEHRGEDGEVRVSLRKDRGYALLRVENDGDPLPGLRGQLFDAFFSAGKSKNGSENLGLGLFVAKTIAESHDGVIFAEDLPERSGARFSVKLPACEAASLGC